MTNPRMLQRHRNRRPLRPDRPHQPRIITRTQPGLPTRLTSGEGARQRGDREGVGAVEIVTEGVCT